MGGCGGDGGSDAKPSPTPSPPASSPTPDAGDGLTATWVCTQQHDLVATHHWTVTPDILADKGTKGSNLDSSAFEMAPFRGTFHLKLFPQGQMEDAENTCTIFLVHSLAEDWNAALNITMNGVTKTKANV